MPSREHPIRILVRQAVRKHDLVVGWLRIAGSLDVLLGESKNQAWSFVSLGLTNLAKRHIEITNALKRSAHAIDRGFVEFIILPVR